MKPHEGLDDVEEIRNKFAVKVAKAHEQVYCINRLQRSLFMDSSELDRVHQDLPFFYDQAEVFSLRNIKHILLYLNL